MTTLDRIPRVREEWAREDAADEQPQLRLLERNGG